MPLTIDGNYANSDQTRIGSNPVYTDSVREVPSGTYGSSATEGLSQGQTVSGQIVDKEGDQVTIRLDNDRTISAKLAGNADIEVGMKLTFEIAKSDGKLALRPLYSNLSGSSAAMSALKAAGLPVNNTTLTMTDKMMSESMPINRNALAQMFRNVSSFSNVSPESIVQMTKLNMPLTESSVIQFDNYRNFEHQITGDLQNAANGIADLLGEAVSLAGDGEAAAAFAGLSAGEVIGEVLELIDTGSLETILPENGQTAEGSIPGAVQTDTMQTDTVQTGVVQENAEPGAAASSDAAVNPNLSLTAAEQQTLVDDLQSLMILAGKGSDIHEPLNPSDVITSIKELVQEYPPDEVIRVEEAELPAYSEETNEAVEEGNLQNAERSEVNSLREHADGAAPAADAGKEANPAAASGSQDIPVKAQIHEKLNEVLRSEGFTKLVRDSVKAQMSIRPEDVAEKGKIEELYDKIQKTSGKISQIMENIGRSDSPVAASAQALTDNVNFMNELNQFVNYVQLPLKMAGEDANGELYVYTNRKNLADNDGNYSALLHLDMEHLGPMDVYVMMRDHTKVSTNFFLESEEMLDFIESHIDELTRRLTEKGYNTDTKVTQREAGKPITPIADEFTKEDAATSAPVAAARMRFDVRA